MKWPWQKQPLAGVLALRRDGATVAWVLAEGEAGRPQRLRASGEAVLDGDDGALAAQLRALAPRQVLAVLPLQSSQLLQIEAPAVPAEELRAAARWRIKDLVEGALDDYTIDVMAVGDGQARGTRQLYVAAARNAEVRAVCDLAQAAQLPLAVIDITETAQRNLQTAAAAAAGLGGRATAALLRHGSQCLLTLSCDGELFEARRLDAALLDALAAGGSTAPGALADDPAAPLPEDWDYVDYGAAGAGGEAEGEADSGHERLLLELQRSFDVWERSQPQRPLAALWLQVGPESPALAQRLGRALGLRAEVLDAAALFPGLDPAGPGALPLLQALPLLGALLRHDGKQP